MIDFIKPIKTAFPNSSNFINPVSVIKTVYGIACLRRPIIDRIASPHSQYRPISRQVIFTFSICQDLEVDTRSSRSDLS